MRACGDVLSVQKSNSALATNSSNPRGFGVAGHKNKPMAIISHLFQHEQAEIVLFKLLECSQSH